MGADAAEPTAGGLLAAVGLDDVHSSVYVYLLGRQGADVDMVATECGISVSDARRALRVLHRCGLVEPMQGHPSQYLAAPPDVAIDAVVLRKQRELDELRASARELVRRQPGTGSGQALEFVSGNEAVLAAVAALEHGAQEEVLVVDCPPYLMGTLFNSSELQGLARGVRYRAVYHAPVLQDPERLEHLQRYVDAGEECRAIPHTELKMLIADRQAAIVPVIFGQHADERMVIRGSALIDTLVFAFETLWSQATPMECASDGARPDQLDRKHADVLRLMATGAKDRAIARALDVTPRTVIRRISRIMDLLSADTRFQAGVQAARRGWL